MEKESKMPQDLNTPGILYILTVLSFLMGEEYTIPKT